MLAMKFELRLTVSERLSILSGDCRAGGIGPLAHWFYCQRAIRLLSSRSPAAPISQSAAIERTARPGGFTGLLCPGCRRFSFKGGSMNLHRSVCVSFLLILAVSPCVASHAWSNQILVDDDKVECPGAKFTSIKTSVNAASPGEQIIVCKGIYKEQVVIRKPLSIDAASGAILMPSTMQANSMSLF